MATNIDYQENGKAMRGVLYRATGTSKGAVLVVPEAPGLGPMPKRRAEMLAGVGYDAFVADLYGDGHFEGYGDSVMALMGTVASVPGLLLKRVRAALDAMVKETKAAPEKTFGIGYCFGGTGILELACSGAPVARVVCFHGILPADAPKGEIKTRILLCTASADPFVPVDQVATFAQKLEAAKAHYEVDLYGGGVGHAFTSHEIVGDLKKPGFGFDETADRRSWAAMSTFFAEA